MKIPKITTENNNNIYDKNSITESVSGFLSYQGIKTSLVLRVIQVIRLNLITNKKKNLAL